MFLLIFVFRGFARHRNIKHFQQVPLIFSGTSIVLRWSIRPPAIQPRTSSGSLLRTLRWVNVGATIAFSDWTCWPARATWTCRRTLWFFGEFQSSILTFISGWVWLIWCNGVECFVCTVQVPGPLPYILPEVQGSVLVHQPAGVCSERLHPADQQPQRGLLRTITRLSWRDLCDLSFRFIHFLSETGHRAVPPPDVPQLLAPRPQASRRHHFWQRPPLCEEWRWATDDFEQL